MKKILIISNSKLDNDPRVFKQISYLKNEDFFIITAGKSPSGIEDEFFQMPIASKESIWNDLSFKIFLLKLPRIMFLIKILLLKKIKLYKLFYWNTYTIKKTYKILSYKLLNCDLIIANDIPVVPLALKLAKYFNSKVIVDAHEYEPLHFDNQRFNSFYKDYWFYICKKYLPKVDYMMTVCDGIAEEYSRNFGIECEVMMNLPFSADLKPIKRNDEKIKLIHHGAAQSGRKLENMIELMKYLDDRFEIYFMLLKMDSDYGKKLIKLAENDSRIKFIDPVTMPEIPVKINEFDIGLYLLQPNTFNQKMALPNKIFEFIQARLALAIWPSQEMVKIIDIYDNGVYSEKFEIKDIAEILNKLKLKDIIKMKEKSDKASRELNSEKNRVKLLNIVDKVLTDK